MIHFNVKDLEQNELICFLHIPKTGGKTMWNLLEKQKRDIIVKHGTFFEKFPKPTTYFTLLRDPVDRVVSTYFYIQNYRRDPLHNKVKNMKLGTFLKYMKMEKVGDRFYPKKNLRSIRYRTVNLTTRYLSGGNPRDFKKAFKHLKDECALAGITDLYNEFLFLMTKEFDWFQVHEMKKKNVTSKRLKVNKIPDNIVQQIKELNQNDIKLYDWARKDLLQRIKNLDEKERIALNSFKNSIES